MGRKVASFNSLLFFLCPPCPPAHYYNGVSPTPPPPTQTHINTHSLPCPLSNTGRGWVYTVGFPQLFKRMPTDGRGTFLQGGHVALSLSHVLVSFSTDLTSPSFLSPFKKNTWDQQLLNRRRAKTRELFILPSLSSHRLLHPARTAE